MKQLAKLRILPALLATIAVASCGTIAGDRLDHGLALHLTETSLQGSASPKRQSSATVLRFEMQVRNWWPVTTAGSPHTRMCGSEVS